MLHLNHLGKKMHVFLKDWVVFSKNVCLLFQFFEGNSLVSMNAPENHWRRTKRSLQEARAET